MDALHYFIWPENSGYEGAAVPVVVPDLFFPASVSFLMHSSAVRILVSIFFLQYLTSVVSWG
jgi:hypothetical protein